MANTEYITIQGDRWDTIAYKAYGDATKFNAIQDANPNLPLAPVFEGGIRLLVPILENEESTIKELLPPWKRVASEGEQTAAASVSALNNVPSSPASFDKSFD